MFVQRVFFLACFLSVSAFTEIPDTLLSAAEPSYPPLCIVTPEGTVDGFAVELLRECVRAMGKRVVFSAGPWEELKQGLADERFDVLPMVGRTPEREKSFDFTFPYLSLHGAIFVRKDNASIDGLDDIGGKRVAVMAGDNAEEFLRREGFGSTLVTTPTYQEAFRGLADGDFEAVVAQKLMGMSLVRELKLNSIHTTGPPLERFTQHFCFAVPEEADELLGLLNEGLALVIASGTRERLFRKWVTPLERVDDTAAQIVIGGDKAFPPYEYLGDGGEPAGYNVALSRALAEAMGLKVRIVLDDWHTVRSRLGRGEIDAIPGMFYSAGRDERFDFSAPHAVIQHVICTREGDSRIEIDALADKTILVMNGDICHDYLLEHRLGDSLIACATLDGVLARLSQGEGECALAARLPALHLVKEHGYGVRVGREPVLSMDYCYAVRAGNRHLLSRLSEGLAVLESRGTLRRIRNEYLGVRAMASDVGETVLLYGSLGLGGLLLSAVTLLLWSRTLSRRVVQRTRELSDSERRFRRLAENIPEVFWVGSIDWGRIDYVSPAFETIFGFPCERVYTDPRVLLEYVIDEDRSAVIRAIADNIPPQNAVVHLPEYRIRRPDGAVRWIQACAFVVEDEPGAVREIAGVARDVTELRHGIEALEKERCRARGYLDIAAAIMLGLDIEGRITLLNTQGRAMLKLGDEDPVGLDWFTGFVPESDREPAREEFAKLIAGGGSIDGFFENRIVSRSGVERTIRWHTHVLTDDRGAVVGTLSSGEDVTHQRESEEKIEHMARFPQEAPYPVLRLSAQGSVLFRNQAALDLLRRESIGEQGLVCMLPTGIHALVNEALRDGRTRRDLPVDIGSTALSYTLVPVVDKGYVNLYAFDITDRREAELRLEREREYLAMIRKVSDALNRGATLDDVAGIILRTLDLHGADIGLVSDDGVLRVEGAASVIGPTLARVVRSVTFDLGVDTPASAFYASLDAIRDVSLPELETLMSSTVPPSRKGPNPVIALLRKHAPGQTIIAPLRDTRKRKLGVVLLTKKHGAEFDEHERAMVATFCSSLALAVERDETLRRLGESEARHRALLEGLPDMVFRFDEKGVIREFHAPDSNDLLVAPDRLRGSNVLEIMPPPTDRLIREAIDEALRSAAVRTIEYTLELDGRTRSYEARVMRSGEREVTAVVRDVTEQLQMEERLRQAEKMQAIGQLAGGIAHDFNNQLGGILGNADLIRENTDPHSPITRWADKIVASVRGSADLTSKLLAFARKGKNRAEPVRIAAVVDEAITLLRHGIDPRITIERRIADETIATTGDPTLVQNALLNLGLNARDAMPRGGVLRFTVEPCTLDHSFFADKPYRAPAGAYILIAVSDTGTGMPPAVVEHVFEPFFTTKEVGKGTGMGLAATYGTVKAHDGVIEVESTVGEGTTFRVYLPLRRGERESPEKAIAESGAGGAAGVCRSVLLVDDDEMMRETAEDLLRHRGFRVVACRDGHEAVDYLRANPGTVDVVLLDMMMPVMNGEQTFEELRRMQPALPVVLASGYTVEGEAQRLLDQGVSAFIQKPYRAAQLARTIETVLSEAA